MEYDALRRGCAEFVGAFTLIFVGVGSIVFSSGTGTVGIALAHGLAIAVMASAVGHISGGHFNPAVTFGSSPATSPSSSPSSTGSRSSRAPL